MQAKAIVNGSPVVTTVMFRFRTLTKTGESDCTQTTSLLVK